MSFFTEVVANPNATFETVDGLKGQNSWYVYHTPAGCFETRNEAMKANKCSQFTLASRCKRASFPDWYREIKPAFVDAKESYLKTSNRAEATRAMEQVCRKPVMTYYGVYPSVTAVAQAAGVDGATVRRWIKKYPKHYYYVKDLV